MFDKKKEVIKQHTRNKNFKYSIDNVGLSFSLSIDNKIEMSSFLKLLEEAKNDIKQDLKNF